MSETEVAIESKHKGGWAHLEVWVEWNPEGGTIEEARASGLVDPRDPDTLFNNIADVAFGWGKKHGITPLVSGTINSDPPDWLTEE